MRLLQTYRCVNISACGKVEFRLFIPDEKRALQPGFLQIGLSGSQPC